MYGKNMPAWRSGRGKVHTTVFRGRDGIVIIITTTTIYAIIARHKLLCIYIK